MTSRKQRFEQVRVKHQDLIRRVKMTPGRSKKK